MIIYLKNNRPVLKLAPLTSLTLHLLTRFFAVVLIGVLIF